jgi:methyl coenzyme M reductase subunit D
METLISDLLDVSINLLNDYLTLYARCPDMPNFSGTPDIEIMPERLMDKKKADDLIVIMKDINHVLDVETRKHKFVGGGFLVGRFIVILKESADVEEVIETLRRICSQTLPLGYNIRVGRFVKPRPTVSDYLRGTVQAKKG